MRKTQPKKNITKVKLVDEVYGLPLRKSYNETIVKNAPIIPKPLEYQDIDIAFNEFVDKRINLTIKNKHVPTFTLYSNQRFSEYSQTWSHTDEENNLLTNFKTVSREPNPKPGDNQGGLWNIPGEQKYMIAMRSVLEDNGNESYEVYSMKQPFAVNLTYRIGIIADMYENLNEFNQIINDLFKARQCYIRPNGHYIPLLLEDISDSTEYTISDRKFYSQTVTINAMAYITKKDDFEIKKVPKIKKLYYNGEVIKSKPDIDIDEYFNEKIKNTSIDLTINFKPFQTKTDFIIDTDFNIENIELLNIRTCRISVNDIPYYVDKGFNVKNNDNIKIIIKQYNPEEDAQLKLIGINPNNTYIIDDLPIDVKDDITKFEDVEVE